MREAEALDEVVATLYSCACVEESWESALEAVRHFIGGTTACLRIRQTSGESRDYLTSVGLHCTNALTREWENRAERDRVDTACMHGEVRVCTWHPGEDEIANEVIGEIKAFGISETLYHCFAKSDRSTLTLALTRDEGDPSFDQRDFDKVRHIGKHFAYAVKLREQHIKHGLAGRHQAEALDQLSIGGLLVDRFGSVIPLNKTATDLLADGDCLRLNHGKISAALRGCNTRLQEILKKTITGETDGQSTYALAIERRSERRPFGVVIYATKTMCPVSNRMENSALIFVRDAETSFETDPLLLQKLFSFTPAEANLAIGLAKGQPLKEIESSLSIRHNTARAHLRAMFIKAEVTRQAELVSLLTNSIAPLGRRQLVSN
ncbi:MAG: helix-turn-helix transcriptional regulator [Sphingomonadaceae bacterium]